MAEQGVDHLAGRQGDAPEQHQALAQLERPALHRLDGVPPGVEEPVLGLLDRLVQRLDRPEVPVDEIVQQPVQQKRHAVLGQVLGAVPASHDGVDVEGRVLADGDEGVVGDERGDLVRDQLARVLVERRRVGRHEQVGAVPVDLGALRLVERVLDGQLVQAELRSDDGELFAVGLAQVEPDDASRAVLQLVGDLLGRESPL